MNAPNPNPPPRVQSPMILALTLALAGCAASPRVDSARDYPAEKPQTRVENVQVVRHETSIAITNTSATPFGPGTLWINRQFSRTIERFGVGDSISLALSEFKNEHGEPFRAGGFFASERPDSIVQVQFEEDNSTVGFVIVGDR